VNELQVSYAGQRYSFQPGQTVRIGRSTDNDVVVGDSTVSRHHAQVAWGPEGWVFEDHGFAGTFLRGSRVFRLVLHQPTELSLASPEGPVVWIEPARQAAPEVARAADYVGISIPPGHQPMTEQVSSRNPWKIAWTIVGGLAVLVGLVTGVLTLKDKLTGPPTFKAMIESTDQSVAFANFLKNNDGKQVHLDVTCKWSSTACHLANPNIGESSPDETMLVLYTLHPCSRILECTSGAYWLHLTKDPSSNVQIDNGAYGAGSLVVKGPFSVTVEGQLGSAPPEVTNVSLRGR
jgi:FHA domain